MSSNPITQPPLLYPIPLVFTEAINMTVQNPLSALPSEIIREILLRLEGRHLFIAQCVSKQWYSFIESIKLSYTRQPRILIHLRQDRAGDQRTGLRSTSPDLLSERIHDEFTLNECCLRVLGSCNGLVLLGFGEHIMLWNSHMGRFTKVLEHRCLRYSTQMVVAGLCYDPSTSDHKVVLYLCAFVLDDSSQIAFVSSIKNKGWRKVPFPYNYITSRAGVSFNNTLHWI
ncbi:unnamed protein product [Cuscuta epithymum]|uniref:F-box domain-containing protein n=1 Tax=Cuscuta epithymum TaxID=186058 RepID=A0AAV0GJS9_9ASTE|nr:unnamed protein product [Cuscuta epithymum]